ncbi:hypothetical protein BJX63DRAFT_400175 [Aspergillus granulosus]|uniref:Uncharacterized protein n=1 Tax=Aspergillus granulosus TaxID=176169 RepID=A0ABR4H6R5_9EURO
MSMSVLQSCTKIAGQPTSSDNVCNSYTNNKSQAEEEEEEEKRKQKEKTISSVAYIKTACREPIPTIHLLVWASESKPRGKTLPFHPIDPVGIGAAFLGSEEWERRRLS